MVHRLSTTETELQTVEQNTNKFTGHRRVSKLAAIFREYTIISEFQPHFFFSQLAKCCYC